MKIFKYLLFLWIVAPLLLAKTDKFQSELGNYLSEFYPEYQLVGVEEKAGDILRVSLLDKFQGKKLKVSLRVIESKSGGGMRFELKRSCSHVIEDILQKSKKSI